ncbi:MAG: MFS transporter [Steroidobacteraceae bacterium]|nr:MFS transporter [Steroidobacteraceae bacterium]MDW8258546.1 MFS transporter [Gammaproteobacteria bacterium]
MSAPAEKLGPIALAPGVTRRHVLCYLFAALVSIGLFTYLVALTPYVMRVHLSLPEARHGTVAGWLQFWQEIVLLSVIGLWGALSDRIGRRAVYIAGFAICAAAYVLYPLASGTSELLAYRLVFGVGIAAMAAMLATVLADYPAEDSRGKLIGLAFFLNGVGSVAFFVFMTRLPTFYAAHGADDIAAGRYAYFTVAAIALLAAVVMLGLKPGRPDQIAQRESIWRLAASGLNAARNARIALAYGSAFAARADMALISLFLSLWVMQSAVAQGSTSTAAAAQVGATIGIAQGAAVLWAPLFGWLGDRMDRTWHLALAFALGVVGYGWIAAIDNPLAGTATFALIALGIGQSSTILASTLLLGQEAPVTLRGSIFGVQSFIGGLGILAISAVGGRLFDAFGAHSPFLLMAIANGVVLLWAALLAVARPEAQTVHAR